MLCVFGPQTFVPFSWKCNKQTGVSHSSATSEIYFWMLVREWTVCQRCNFRDCVSETFFAPHCEGETSRVPHLFDPNLTLVSPTHHVDLDWLFERVIVDSSMSITCVRTTEQLPGVLTTGALTAIDADIRHSSTAKVECWAAFSESFFLQSLHEPLTRYLMTITLSATRKWILDEKKLEESSAGDENRLEKLNAKNSLFLSWS